MFSKVDTSQIDRWRLRLGTKQATPRGVFYQLENSFREVPGGLWGMEEKSKSGRTTGLIDEDLKRWNVN